MEKIEKVLEGIVWRELKVRAEIELSAVPEGIEGDFATNVAMRMYPKLRSEESESLKEIKNPRELAQFLAEKVNEEEVGLRAEVAGPGFLNIILGDEVYKEIVQKYLTEFLEAVKRDDYVGQRVVTEFSDPNPFKVLHIGHLYTSVMGESISRLIEFSGGEVHRVNFGGDVGLHVAKTLYAIISGAVTANTFLSEARSSRPSSRGSAANTRQQPPYPPTEGCSPDRSSQVLAEESSPEQPPYLLTKEHSSRQPEEMVSRIEDIARAYIEGTRLYEEDEEAKRAITELNKKIYRIAELGEGNYAKLDEEEEKLARMYWKGREVSYKYFVQFYDRIGVEFEKFYPESAVVGLGVETVNKEFGQGVYEKSEGAVVFKGEKFGLHTRVFINKEGVPTYETKDVGLLLAKDRDFQFDKSIVITGNEQREYMRVVLKSIEQYAPELVQKTEHITHGMVRLPGNQKMSSRKGNFVKAVDVLDEVDEKTKNEVVTLGAIKYAFLKYKIGGDIVFDADESVSMTGNSGVYLLYSTVRAKKIVTASRFKEVVSGKGEKEDYQYNEFEKKLIKKFMEYPGVLGEAVRNLAPHLIANYLFEAAQEFSRFYEECRVVGDKKEKERIKLVRIFKEIMEHGLGLLGILVPREM